MIRRISVILLWVLATMVATAVALAAVGSVAGQVIDSPVSPLLEATTTSLVAAAAPSASISGVPVEVESLDPITVPTTTSTTTSTITSTAVVDTSSSAAPSTTSAPVSTTAAPGSGTTSTTVPDDDDDDEEATTTSSTQSPAPSETATYQLIGGWVRITYGSGSVTLDGAGPNAGFTMDIDASGPSEVDVDFRNEDHRSNFKAEWENGKLEVDVDEEPEGD
jgi:hypothetical protein